MLLQDSAVPTILGRVEESEARAVSNKLLVFYLCLNCVSYLTKRVVSTVECGGAHGGEKGGGGSYTDRFERM